MAGFVEGVDRGQNTLFPALLEDNVAEDNPVRAVDVFVDDLNKLGFVGVQPLDIGRPAYHPRKTPGDAGYADLRPALTKPRDPSTSRGARHPV